MSRDPSSTLVTIVGGSGFLGRNITQRLAKDSYRIRVMSRRPSLAYFLPSLGAVGQIVTLRADIGNEAELKAAIRGAHIVVNLVGILRESGGQAFEAVHTEGAATVARLSKQLGVRRLIHMSSIGADKNSRSSYARTKAQGEERARAEFPDITILRPSVVFGPGDGFFNRFAALMRMMPLVFPLFGGGKTKFQPVFVGDVAEAVASALNDERTRGRTYELGGPAIYTFRELLAYISKVTERKRAFIPIPFFILDIMAALTGWLPFAPVTLDQARLLRVDNVVKAGADAASVGTLADLKVPPTAVEAVAPSYLYTFRRTGQYAEARGA